MRGDHPLTPPREAVDVYGPALESISHYVDILTSRGIDYGLIGPREADRVWDRHVLNSAALTGLVPTGARLVDVGSGAGLPGLPLAILRPDLEVSLLEPLLRRTRFLTEAVAELGLADRVRVVRARAEEHRDTYEVVTARAVAPLPRLVPWCAPLREPDGIVLALKGSSAADEVRAATAVLAKARLRAEVLELRAHPRAEPTTVVRLTADRGQHAR
ncbi:16S rRNA (guanine(527)-N(7))-methyltransferase RsmG [Microlunatus ginsengisoli]|uniref:Ribosomal RNA small subunit methyltransferase G n=1 Tax=Microlunatus ginsengisoli TaxID=363863 RepID=A0ABP6ZZA6_9ACTN